MKKNQFPYPSIESETIASLTKKLLETTELLQSANQELLKLQREQSEMLANLSHDLRAPLTAIRSAAEYLLSQPSLDWEELEASLNLINRRSQTMESLFQDMDYLFRVDGGTGSFSVEPMDAAPFFEEYYCQLLTDDNYHAHPISLNMDADLDCRISIDSQKIIRVLDNLFTNAAKYSAPGTAITLTVCRQEDFLNVSVADKGIGIPEDAIDKIFNRTYTVSSARTPDSVTGSGLGLAIVKAIVTGHGGVVSCDSSLGKGSVFSFSIPICP